MQNGHVGGCMDVIAPRFRTFDVHGAFVIDKAALERLASLLRTQLGDATKISYEMSLSDGAEQRTSEIEELEIFPFHEKRQVRNFKIKGSNDSGAIVLDFQYFLLKYSGRIYVTISNVDQIAQADAAVRQYLSGVRNWYDAVYQMPWWIYAIVSLLTGVLVPILVARLKLGSLYLSLGLSVVGLVAISGGLFAIRSILFDRFSMYFGPERANLQRKEAVRLWVFRSAIGGGVLLSLTAIVQAVARREIG